MPSHDKGKLSSFHQLLPRPDSRRGLINLGGTVLRTPFGTATVADIFQIQESIETLKRNNGDIAHSLLNQVTYIKNLDTFSRVNTEAIANMSKVVKDFMINAREKFYETNRDIMWLNVTMYSQSEIYMAVRQLEFSILQLSQQIDGLLAAIQFMLHGKMAMTLISPVVLHSILRNISFHLPENYELVAGTKLENIYRYYDLVKVTITGNSHNVQMIMSLPIKTVNQQFTLYKLVVMPSRILKDKFMEYNAEFSHFGLSYSQRDYILIKEEHLQQFIRGSLTICPANIAIHDVNALSCEASLFFQSMKGKNQCRRNLLLHYQTSSLQRHGSTWIYHFPKEESVTIRCPKGTSWITHTQQLRDGGIIHGATTCAITTHNLRTLPEVRQVDYTFLDNPVVYVPDLEPILSAHETPKFEEMIPADTLELDHIKTLVKTPHKSLDVDTLFQVHELTVPQQSQQYWLVFSVTSVCVLTMVLAIGCMLRSKFYYLFHCSANRSKRDSNPRLRDATQQTFEIDQVSNTAQSEQQENVGFTTYSLQAAIP
jgi:cell division protein FtsB